MACHRGCRIRRRCGRWMASSRIFCAEPAACRRKMLRLWEDDMRSEVMGTLGAAGLVLACAVSAMAQDAPVRVRGTIDHVDGQSLMIKARDGKDLTVKLA